MSAQNPAWFFLSGDALVVHQGEKVVVELPIVPFNGQILSAVNQEKLLSQVAPGPIQLVLGDEWCTTVSHIFPLDTPISKATILTFFQSRLAENLEHTWWEWQLLAKTDKHQVVQMVYVHRQKIKALWLLLEKMGFVVQSVFSLAWLVSKELTEFKTGFYILPITEDSWQMGYVDHHAVAWALSVNRSELQTRFLLLKKQLLAWGYDDLQMVVAVPQSFDTQLDLKQLIIKESLTLKVTDLLFDKKMITRWESLKVTGENLILNPKDAAFKLLFSPLAPTEKNVPALSKKSGKSEVTEDQAKKNMARKLTILAIVFGVVAAMLITLVVMILWRSNFRLSDQFFKANQLIKNSSPSPTPEIALAITPVPDVVDNSSASSEVDSAPQISAESRLLILNAAGITGAAAKVQALFKEMGYKSVKIGNTTKSNDPLTYIYSADASLITELDTVLSKQYSIATGSAHPKLTDFDAVILLGKPN